MARLFLTPASRGRAAVLWTLGLFALTQLALGLWIVRRHPDVRDPEYSSVCASLRARRGESPDRPLLLMLGSSRVANALRPAVLTRSLAGAELPPLVFNAALLWGGPLHELLVFRRLLADGVRPDWLLIEVFPPMLTQQGAFCEEGFLTARGLQWTDGPLVYRYFRERAAGLERLLQEGIAPALCHRARFLERFAPMLLPRHDGPIVFWPDCGTRDPDESGWLPAPAERGSAADFQRRVENNRAQTCAVLEPFQVKPTADRALHEMLDECARRHIRAALVIMPEHSTLRDCYTPAARQRVQAYLTRLHEEYQVPILDTRTWVPDEDFFDMAHVLPRAAAPFSERFGRAVLRPWLQGRNP
jgi:hypothetical protein